MSMTSTEAQSARAAAAAPPRSGRTRTGDALDAMNADLHERLDALESDEHRGSEAYRLGDRVVASSLFWLGTGIAVWVLTLLLWQ